MNDQPTDRFDPQIYRALFERAGVGMALLDRRGHFIAANPAACELLGYSCAELIAGPALADLVHPDDRAANAERMAQLLRGELNPLRLEQRFARQDGHIVWADTFITHLSPLQAGTVEGDLLLAELHDITAYRQTEQELQAERDLFNALLEAIPDHVYFKDRESRFIRNSRSHARFVGLDDPAQMIGKTDFDVFDADHAAEYYADEQRIIETGEPLVSKLEQIRRADGQFRWVTASKVPLRDHEGRIIGTMGISRDVDEQVRLQQELERQRRMLQAVLDTLPEFISFKDRDLAHVLCNKAVLELHGCSMAEMYGKTDFDLYPAEEAARYAEEERQAMRTGQPVVAVRPVPTPGRIVWEECIKMPLRDESGQVVGVLSVGRDVTAQREQEKRLRLTRFSFDHALASLFWVTPEGRFVDVNEMACRTLGYSRQELLAMHVWDIDPNPEHSAATRAARWEMLKQRGSLHFETTNLTRDGRIVPVEITNQYLRHEDEEYEFAFVVDISERKQAEAALRAERNLLRTLIDALSDHVYVKDRQGRLLLANVTQARHLGFADPTELIGKTDFDLHPAGVAEAIWANDRLVLETGAPLSAEEEFVDPQGKSRWVWSVKAPLRDEQGQVIGLVGMSRDITEKRRLEAQLRQSQKMEAIGTLAGGVAHDFNNLLTSIIGYSDFLLGSLDPLSPAHEDATTIKRMAERAADLTRQLLAFSRRQIMRPQVVNLNTAITNLLRMLKRVVSEDIELVTDLAPDLGNVRVDPGQLEQVLMNLIVNAREAMPHGGRLVIATANATLTEEDAERYAEVMPGPYVRLTISDTGVGMDAETLSRIFDPFFTTKERGTGLGLATVYGIVKQSGGHITVESEPGRGATFHVYLPLTEAAETVAAEAAGRPVGGTETVLLVEDDEAVREMLRRALERLGYTVREAANAAEAVRICQSEPPPDLLLTDMIMPGGMNGQQLAARLREMQPGLKVMYISGYSDLDVVGREFLDEGAVFLPKPFNFADLGRLVRRALDGA